MEAEAADNNDVSETPTADSRMELTDDQRESTHAPGDFHPRADIDVSAISAVSGPTQTEVKDLTLAYIRSTP